jgi:hypothetical protein
MTDENEPKPTDGQSVAVIVDGKTVWEVRRDGMYLDGQPVWADTHGFLRWGHGEPCEPDDPADVEYRLGGTRIQLHHTVKQNR